MVRRLSVSGVLLAVGTGAGLLPLVLHLFVTSHAGVSSVLLGNIAAVSLVAAGVVIHCHRLPFKVAMSTPWLACGALVGSALIGPLRIGPYVLIAAVSFGLLGIMRGVGGVRGALTRTGCVLAAAVVNFACLWPFTLGLHRPSAPAQYLSLDLRVHTLLADIPLHDVWVADLPGGGTGRTLVDVHEAMAGGVTGDETVALAAAVTAYMLAARVLGLASEQCFDTLSPARRRLTEADRSRSIYKLGERGFVYYFEREALLEIQTCTARAYYAFALAPEASGYTLYWGVYADSVSWFTPYYMSLIDPVRRLVVFPSFLQRIEKRWRANWRADHESSDASVSAGAGSAAEASGERSW
ncbi:MAG: DUF2867 domain-containing protein [Gemmatimonadota bacterium]|nr:MAG: DUF2867 domain-containing protein [Gemmatimonadota bacterium]